MAGLVLAAAGGIATCTPPEQPALMPAPAAVGGGPEIRIGLVIGAARLDVSGDSGLALLDGDGVPAGQTGPGIAWRVRVSGRTLMAQAGSAGQVSDQLSVEFRPRFPGGLVYLNGRPYRGRLQVFRDRTGLTAVNRLGMEEYLAGVVAAEMGRRDPGDQEALTAQAVVSRTFAIRNLGKRASEGFDLYATVVDQVYGGVAAEDALALNAVTRSSGLILTWQGAPIDAFFFSTCGGRTAAGTEVYAGADRPYLRSVSDLDESGQAYCRISPRYHWTESWSADQLQRVLRQSLPAATGTPAEAVTAVEGIEVAARTGSGRVASLRVQLRDGSVDVSGPAVRRVLHPVGEPLLRSALFRLVETREGDRLERLEAEGSGAGHGVGFCQWGAVGRARAGQDAATILAAYFPGTTVSRAY